MAEFKFTGDDVVQSLRDKAGLSAGLSGELAEFDAMLGNVALSDKAYDFVAERLRGMRIHTLAGMDNYRLLPPKMYLTEWRTGYRRS